MSINISARQLLDPGLITTLREAMAEGQCAPSTIVIEVTESVLLHDLYTVAPSLEAIKALDVGLDLDDFGTGYSSLQYLRDLPIDRLKVDQGFVAGLGVNGADTAIVASTIALAHALDLKAIAEGVETDEQLALLREMGCDFAQGYLWGQPADMETFITWLDAYVPAVVPPTSAATSLELSRERHEAAELRDARADTRATAANARETEADTRDMTANARDDTADERERVADLRDVTATDREHAEDDRQGEGQGPGRPPTGGHSSLTRRTAKQARSRATAGRRIDASDRTKASKSRDDASAGRANVARARAKQQSDPVREDDDA